jgi:hypothetical protein
MQKPSLSIYDASGRLVKAFNHESVVIWYGDDDAGRKLPAGVYLLKLEGEGYCANRKIVMVR